MTIEHSLELYVDKLKMNIDGYHKKISSVSDIGCISEGIKGFKILSKELSNLTKQQKNLGD